MTIKKLGHCCLLIKTNGLTILTDPGAFSDEQNSVTGIDVILITHEHFDHLHVPSVALVLKNNPGAQVITNSGVGVKLAEANIAHTIVEGRGSIRVGSVGGGVETVEIEAFDGKHEEIFEDIGQVQNTGYFIAGKLFYPGDSFHIPGKAVDVLALPVAGPWCKIPDAIRYALAVRPKKVFPVHDGMLQPERIGSSHKIPEKVLTAAGIEFIAMNAGDEREV